MNSVHDIDGVNCTYAADVDDEDTAPVASVEDDTVARSRDISRDDLAVELERETMVHMEMRTMGEDGSRSVESRCEVEEDMLDGTVMSNSNMVTRYIDSQETLPDRPDLVVRVVENEDGDGNKVRTINWNKLS